MPESDSSSISRNDRRGEVPESDSRGVTFTGRKLSAERLEALRTFLTTATADDIAMVRRSYADVPEVLQMIALELGREAPEE